MKLVTPCNWSRAGHQRDWVTVLPSDVVQPPVVDAGLGLGAAGHLGNFHACLLPEKDGSEFGKPR